MRPSIALLGAGAVDDGGVVLVHRDALGAAQVFQANAFQLDAGLFHDGLAAGQDADVFEHRFAAIAEAGSLHRASIQRAAQLVDYQSGQRFAFHFFGDHQQRLAGAGDLLEQRQQILHVADLLFVDQDVGIFEHALHAVRIADEVGREIAAVELHAVHGLQLGVHGPGFFHRDDAVLADLLHRFGDGVADGRRRRWRKWCRPARWSSLSFTSLENFFTSSTTSSTAFSMPRFRAIGFAPAATAFTPSRKMALRQDGGGGGAVAGGVGGLRSNLAHHLRAHVLERILQFDFLGDGDAVLGDGRAAELFLENDVAAAGAKRHLHGISQLVDAAQNRLTGIFAINNLFCCH